MAAPITQEVNLLIISSDLSEREKIKVFLRDCSSYNFHFYEAAIGLGGLKIFESETIDCIILDYHLPDINGFVALDIISKLDKALNVPIVLIFSDINEVNSFDLIKKGAKLCISKEELSSDFFKTTFIHEIDLCLRSAQEDKVRRKSSQQMGVESINVFMSSVANELNNPLTVIMGLAQEVLSSKDLERRFHESVSKIVVSAKEMEEVIKKLAHFGRTFSQNVKDNVNLEKCIEDVLLHFNNIFISQKVNVEKTINKFEGTFCARTEDLKMIFQKLFNHSLDNFVEYAQNKQKNIKINSFSKDGNLIIEYSDNCKLHKEKKLNDYFTKNSNHGPRRFSSLNLAIIHDVIRSFNGQLNFKDNDEAGISFEMVFPLISSDFDGQEVLEGKKSDVEKRKTVLTCRPNIMVVDDNALVCEVVESFLSDRCSVEIFTDSVEAMKKIESFEYDLVLADLKMPIVNGIDIVEAVKKHWPTTPVVIMSGYGREDRETQYALEAGAVALLTKPFINRDQIWLVLKQYLT